MTIKYKIRIKKNIPTSYRGKIKRNGKWKFRETQERQDLSRFSSSRCFHLSTVRGHTTPSLLFHPE